MSAKPPPKRVHPSGRLTFRSNVRAAKSEDLPIVEADDDAIDWSQIVPTDWPGEVELEIGCGKGKFLVAGASTRPETFFVGCEAGPDYARYCADRIKRQELTNAKLIADDARLLLADSVPAASLRRIHVYHPDPWPKRRHRKRRIFDKDFASLCVRALRPDGELLVATDNTRYFGEILTVLGAEPGLRRARSLEAEYGDQREGLAFGPTNFAEKYVAEERQRHRAVYVLTRDAEPQRADNGATSATEDDAWRKVAAVADIPADEGLAITVDGLELAVFRDGEELRCIQESCPHRGAALSEGFVQDGEVVCPWHGWRYSLRDGECSTLPGSAPVACYAAEARDGDVWIRI